MGTVWLIRSFLFVIIINLSFVLNADEIQVEHHSFLKDDTTDLIYSSKKDDRLLLFATLDGNLIAIEQKTGRIRWKIKDKPIVQVPIDTTNAIVPIFLPDPRDGSLYLFGGDGGGLGGSGARSDSDNINKEFVQKLPFTIPQLVASAPCRSSDGILYTGRKKDTWFKLDPRNGNKERILGWQTSSPTCPIDTTTNSIYIARTKYDIMMVDSRNPLRKWNVTYYDYASMAMSKEDLKNYDLAHFASTSSGRLMTMDRRRGTILWDGDLGSPVIAVYILDNDGLLMAPFTSLANHTLSYLAKELMLFEGNFVPQPHRMKLYPTLYIGDHLHGLYALPSLVDQNVVTITASEDGPLLLGGPHAPNGPKLYPEYPIPGHNYRLPSNSDSFKFQSVPHIGDSVVIYIGHYNVPQYSDTRFLLRNDNIQTRNVNNKPIQLLTDESLTTKEENNNAATTTTATVVVLDPQQQQNIITRKKTTTIGIQTTIDNNNNVFIKSTTSKLFEDIERFLNTQDNKGLKLMLIILSGCVVGMFWYLQIQVREFQNLSSQNNSQSSRPSNNNTSNNSSSSMIMTTSIISNEELPNGLVRVGKITFDPQELLGKGCEGTFVYRGEFDNRKVAVKRLLPECFTFADREVALLRESDTHPNVIRYHCMEQDRMFRYIALELCYATLTDYVQRKCDTTIIEPLDLLYQATAGLEHLHSLDIVHRDIKPHNVLLSIPYQKRSKAMISDFGLCKKLQVGRVSFSRRSGVTGTDGWIAPEMLNGNERTTFAVDLFSLGCVFYYVLSHGLHPFGDSLRRQANILTGEYNLNDLKDELWQINVQKPLIAALISSNVNERPNCQSILMHPMFWDNSKILTFFQDVSDRVELSDVNDLVLESLEDNALSIVRYDWRLHIDEEVVKDLRKYRSYRGQSVRDLLRALRNKKHHFRELTHEAQQALGDIPNAFTNYWNSRFPFLFIHTYISLQCVADENTFSIYYPSSNNYYQYSITKLNQFISEYYANNSDLLNIELLKESSLRRFFDDHSDNISSPKRQNYSTNYINKRFNNNNKTSSSSKLKNINDGLGLYRNLLQQQQNDNDDDDNVVKSTTVSNNKGLSLKQRSNNNYKKKSASSKNDEPITWAITQKK